VTFAANDPPAAQHGAVATATRLLGMNDLDALAGDRPSLVSELDVSGAKVKYWTYPAVRSGADSGALAPPRGVILMVHGFRGDRHGLRRIVNELPGYTIVVPDLPGFGSSTPFPELTHDTAAYGLVIEALRRELRLPPEAVLFGHSFGTVVAAHYLAAHPGTFSCLVLVNPICEPALDGEQAAGSRVASAYYSLAASLPERAGLALLRSRLVADSMSAVMGKSSDPTVRGYVRDQHRRYFGGFSDRRCVQEAYAASIAGTVRQVAPAIRVPVLLVVGELDELGTVAKQQAMAEEFSEASLHVIPAVGHLVHYETPATAARLVAEFLAPPPAAAGPWA
jgi:esterase